MFVYFYIIFVLMRELSVITFPWKIWFWE